MAAINIVDNYHAEQYTGSNGTAIAAAVTNCNIISETGGVLTIESPTGSTVYVINAGEWVRWTQNMIVSAHPTAAFNLYFNEYATKAELDALAATVASNTASIATLTTAAAAGVRAVGVKDCPTLLLNSSTVIPVTITPGMPSGTFTAEAMLFGPVTVLATLTVTAVTATSATTVDVTVQNSGVAAVGAHLLVVVKA